MGIVRSSTAQLVILALLVGCQTDSGDVEQKQSDVRTEFVAYRDVGLSAKPVLKTEMPQSGLKVETLRLGTGKLLTKNKLAYFHFTGWLAHSRRKFDSTIDRGHYLVFTFGVHSVNPGFDAGVQGMKVGEMRRLWIRQDLGYGEAGAGPVPPMSDLIYEVELLAVEDQ